MYGRERVMTSAAAHSGRRGTASDSEVAAANEVEACADGVDSPLIVGTSGGRSSISGRARAIMFLARKLAVCVAAMANIERAYTARRRRSSRTPTTATACHS